MLQTNIPQVKFAHIGGSGTWAGNFPENTGLAGAKVLQDDMQFETPFGTTVPMKLVELDGSLTADGQPRQFLSVPFHGFHGLAPHNTPAEQIFWVFQNAGVKFILADGSGGGINTLLDPGDIIIPHDFIDLTKRQSQIHHFTSNIVRMQEPLCHDLRGVLADEARKEYPRVFARGVYATTEAPRFETASEINWLKSLGCDLTGHTIVPECYLARAIGACYASIYIVSNFAEGVGDASWAGSSIFEHYSDSTERFGRIIVRAMGAIAEKETCDCTVKGIIEVPSNVKKTIGSDEA